MDAHSHTHSQAAGHTHSQAAGHTHGHTHGHAGARHSGRLRLVFVLIVAFLVVQVGAGVATHSLALLSDAGHMATDALGLGMALAAITAAGRSSQAMARDRQRTFGLYRLEILAALANAALLFAVATYVLVEAVQRFRDPREIASMPVLVVGTIGLAVNVVAFLLLRSGASESLNVRGAYLEVVSDLLGSIGVIVAAFAMRVTGWEWVDPLIGAAIGLFILPRARSLGREALRVLLQAAPADIDVSSLEASLVSIAGVSGVHDLHVWTLTSEMEVVTAHLEVSGEAVSASVLCEAKAVLREGFGLEHATLQIEPNARDCESLSW